MPQGDYSLWNSILQGRSPFGSSGFDIMNTLSQTGNAPGADPRLSRYFDPIQTEGGMQYRAREGGPNEQGYITRNGQHYVQVGGVPDDERVLNRDPSQFQYDPEFGLLTTASNIHTQDSFLDRWAPYMVGAGLAAPAMLAAMGAMGGVAAGAGVAEGGGLATGAFDSGIFGVGGGVTPSLYGAAVEPFAGAAAASPFAGATASGEVGADAFAGATASAEGGSPFSFNNIRTGINAGRSLLGALGGNNSGGRMPSSSGGFDLSSILGLLGIGHNMFGNGIGTANGALANAHEAAGIADPWGPHRAPFQAALDSNALGMLGIGQNPADAITSNPAYQFELSQGMNAIDHGNAAQGTLRSGGRMAELQKYGTGLAASYWDRNAANNRLNLGVLGNLAGVNAGGPGDAARALTGGWENASNIRSAGGNSLFSGGAANPLAGILGLLGQGATGVGSWLQDLFGNGGDGGAFAGATAGGDVSGDFWGSDGFDLGDGWWGP